MMDRPERAAALEYLHRKGTAAPVDTLVSEMRSAFEKLERAVDAVPDALRASRPDPVSWSVHEIVDHLVESDRPAVEELRQLCAGVAPQGGPIPARLLSARPLDRPWAALVDELKSLHATLLEIVRAAGPDAPTIVRAPIVIVMKVPGPGGPEVLEWVEALDWKAYAQALRVHTRDHCAQVNRTVAAIQAVR